MESHENNSPSQRIITVLFYYLNYDSLLSTITKIRSFNILLEFYKISPFFEEESPFSCWPLLTSPLGELAVGCICGMPTCTEVIVTTTAMSSDQSGARSILIHTSLCVQSLHNLHTIEETSIIILQSSGVTTYPFTTYPPL